MRSEIDRLSGIEGEFGGHEVHIEPGAPRLSNLFNKSPAFDRLLACAPTLAAAAYLLGEIRVYSLNAPQSCERAGTAIAAFRRAAGLADGLAGGELHGGA